ncbi:diguanylate cyclase [Halocella sp. SP3-1]|uniref:sensor domain-containing diguanylate cyclase n=1 Tax=Halocella sp. SP3-1 TaxID=2382161 RepID=UPI000F75925B|nr:diguanylate cyclase [Halocella sp. SP3-1]AZO94450.1 diguanylate cyclase [Halocella sp. SP3-1]
MSKRKLIFIIILLCTFLLNFTSITKAEIIDLSNYDLTEKNINLNGKWEFYWKQLLEPTDFQEKNLEPSSIVEVPTAWNGYQLQDKKLPGMGYATYRLRIHIKNNTDLIGLRIPPILTSYKLWINSKLIASAGKVGTSRVETDPQYLPQLAFFKPEEENEIIIQVANFYHRSGGILQSIMLGEEKNILAENNKRLGYNLFLFGALFIMGIYHLIIYLYRKKSLSVFYFSLFCILLSIRTVLLGEYFFIYLFPDFNWELFNKLHTLSYYLSVYILIIFFKAVFSKYMKKTIVKISVITVAVFILLVLLSPARVYTYINPGYQLFTIIIIIYIIPVLYRVVLDEIIKMKNICSLYIVSGAVILLITVLNDILFFSILRYDHHFLKSFIIIGNLSSLGLLIFALTNSLALAVSFANAFNENEKMSIELQKLNENLESIIKERTREIQISNDKIREQKSELEKANLALQKISKIDPLTNIWNRRHFDKVLLNKWKQALNEQLPVSIFFIDIDDFKAYNDYYGHTAGDECIKQVTRQIKHSLTPPDELVARYGGEEFVVLLANTDIDKARKKAEIIQAKIESLNIPNINSTNREIITISLGITSVIPTKKLLPEDLIMAADKAMYLAKNNGKNKIKIIPI